MWFSNIYIYIKKKVVYYWAVLLLLLSCNTLEFYSSPKIYFLDFLYHLPFHPLLKNISAVLVVSLDILHWLQIGLCSFSMILLDVLFIHMHNRSWCCFSSTGFLYLLFFSYVILLRLFVWLCVSIHLLHSDLICYAY